MAAYVSQTGAGRRDGSSFSNAIAIKDLTTAAKLAAAGDGKILLLADNGPYNLTGGINLYVGGTADKPLVISGATHTGEPATVNFIGTRAPVYTAGMAAGNESFRIMAGANHVVFEGMNFANVGNAFRVGGDVTDLTIRDMQADNVAMFFQTLAAGNSTTATVSGLKIEDVEVHGFSKGVIRINYDSHDIVIDKVHGDSEHQDGDNFAMGVQLFDTVHDVLITNAIMENIRDTTNSYWNGDGFATEAKVYNVTIADSISRGNTDGGFDLKSTNTLLLRTVAEGNARNYRIWGETTLQDVVGLNPEKRGGVGSQVQVEVTKTGHATVIDSTFIDAGYATAVYKVDGFISIEDTFVVHGEGRSMIHRDSTNKSFDYGTDIVTVATSASVLATPDFTFALPVAPDTVVVTAPLIHIAPLAAMVVFADTPAAPPAAAMAEFVTAPAAVAVAAGETVDATAAAESFQIAADGLKRIRFFAIDDVAVLERELADSDHDGVVEASSSGSFYQGADAAFMIDGVTVLRHLGQDGDRHVYGVDEGALTASLPDYADVPATAAAPAAYTQDSVQADLAIFAQAGLV